jgi:hypothetical protein
MPTLLIVQVGLLLPNCIARDGSDCERAGTSSVVLDTVLTTNYESQDTSGVIGMQIRDTPDNPASPREPPSQSFTPIFARPRGVMSERDP